MGASMRVISAEPDEAKATTLPEAYWQACRLAEQGQYDDARRLYSELEDEYSEAGPSCHLLALIRNDLAVLAVLNGRHDDARQGWQAAMDLDPGCLPARLNRDLLAAELDDLGGGDPAESRAGLVLAPNPARTEPRPPVGRPPSGSPS